MSMHAAVICMGWQVNFSIGNSMGMLVYSIVSKKVTGLARFSQLETVNISLHVFLQF